MENNGSIGVWLWNVLFEIEDFNINDIVIYSMIDGLGRTETGCYATNGYFAKRVKKSNDTVRKSITKLFNLGYITWEENHLYKSNRVLKVTNKISAYLKTDKGLLKNSIVPLVKTSNNNIIDNIYINTTSTTEKIKGNSKLIYRLCKEFNVEKSFIIEQVDSFIEYNNSINKVWVNDTELYKHFGSTLKGNLQKKLKEISKEFNLEDELKWFINMFNRVSNRNYKITPELKQLFTEQFAVGFSGEEMEKAVKNLYSSALANKFHVASSFKFATPEYLLKDNNLNKYSNLKYENHRSKVKRLN